MIANSCFVVTYFSDEKVLHSKILPVMIIFLLASHCFVDY